MTAPPLQLVRLRLSARRQVVGGVAQAVWEWRCMYVDGSRGQHSRWHYDKDNVGWGADYATALDLALAHVAEHVAAGRTPGRFERWLLARNERRQRRRCRAKGWPTGDRWWSA